MNPKAIRECPLFLMVSFLLFIFSCNGIKNFDSASSSSDTKKNEQELWVRKEIDEIRRIGFQKERSFMMECKDPELEEFRANYFKNAAREGVDKEVARLELDMMYWEYHCYWTKYQESKFYFVNNGSGVRYHTYSVKEFSPEGDLLSSNDIAIIPETDRIWDRIGPYVLAWGIDYDGLPPFHAYDLQKRAFMKIGYNPRNQGVVHTLTEKRHTAAATSQNGRLAVVQNNHIWIFEPDKKKPNLICRMRFNPKKYVNKIIALTFAGEDELIIANNQNKIVRLHFELDDGQYFIRWTQVSLLPQHHKVRGISLAPSGEVAVYSPFAARLLLADTGIPISSTFRLEKNLSIKDGIRHLVWLDDGSPAIDLGAYWLVRKGPLISSMLKGQRLHPSFLSCIFSRVEMTTLSH